MKKKNRFSTAYDESYVYFLKVEIGSEETI